FRFLSAVTSMSAAFGREGDPFQPMLRTPTDRSAALGDFSPTDTEVLRQLTAVTDDPEIRARFADVACSRKFSPEMAREAVASYLAAATLREDVEHWPRFHHYLLRAAQLAHRLGRKNQPFADVEKHVEDLLKRASPTDSGLCCVRLLDLVAEFGFGDAATYAALAEEMAERLERASKFDFAGRYWTVAVDLHRDAKRPDDANRCRLRAAETHILEADGLEKQAGAGGLNITHHLSSGLEALRRAGADKDRIEEVHQRLLRAQKESLKEMGTFSHEMDISELKKKAREAVSGCGLRTALIRLATGVDPVDPVKLRAEVEEHAKNFPLQALIPASIVDHEGRVIGQRPSMFTNDPDQYEAALESEMFRHVTGPAGEWPFRVSAFIEPAMMQIFEEYRPDWRDLVGLVRNNPFVPPGHEEFFVRGIHAGLTGDLVAVAQYLAPQVENSIRVVLEQKGVITSKFDEEQIQQVRTLDKLLLLPQTLELFGAGHIFELRGVLSEPLGWNLRNRVAHGLVTADGCYTPASIMLWWLVVRFCVFPLVSQAGEAADSPEQAQ
ncbi:MAG: hypothetical protein QOD99_2949, partial [Chthoniobacter sp.]|nr:hypothetical protein [Chthoniobacter sp.]